MAWVNDNRIFFFLENCPFKTERDGCLNFVSIVWILIELLFNEDYLSWLSQLMHPVSYNLSGELNKAISESNSSIAALSQHH